MSDDQTEKPRKRKSVSRPFRVPSKWDVASLGVDDYVDFGPAGAAANPEWKTYASNAVSQYRWLYELPYRLTVNPDGSFRITHEANVPVAVNEQKRREKASTTRRGRGKPDTSTVQQEGRFSWLAVNSRHFENWCADWLSRRKEGVKQEAGAILLAYNTSRRKDGWVALSAKSFSSLLASARTPDGGFFNITRTTKTRRSAISDYQLKGQPCDQNHI